MNLENCGSWRWIWLLVFALIVGLVNGNVVLIGRNFSLSFRGVEASFAPSVEGSGECGRLYVAEPLDACAPLTKNITKDSPSAFALIIRGGCTFDDKVRHAQEAGFKAAIVYNNEDNGVLVSMAGSSDGIYIYAVFVAKASGEILYKYAGSRDVEIWIIPAYESTLWSIVATAFISLLAMFAVLATCFFIRRHQTRHEQPSTNVREFHGMSSQLVKSMPSLVFETALEDNCTSTTCAICLDDYAVGDKLRVLPCRHKFHALCVDIWLTSWRTFCPVCKQDAKAGIAVSPASERTPLLSATTASPSSNAGLVSSRSSVATSPAIPIIPRPPLSHTNSLPRSSSNSYVTTANRSYSRSPNIGASRSSLDLRNASSLRSQYQSQSISRLQFLSHSCIPTPNSSYSHLPATSSSRSTSDFRNSSLHRSYTQSHIVSPNAFSCPISSPISVNHVSPHIDSSSMDSSSSSAESSSPSSHLRHYSDSASSLSALASAQSLPQC